MQTFTVGGNGGSGKDTSSTGVRVVHKASGAVGQGTETRSQLKNKQLAFGRMARSKEFAAWQKLECARRLGQIASVEKAVDELMLDKHIKIEYY